MLNSTFNDKVMTIVVQVGSVKIYVAIVEAFKKKERRDET